MKKIKKFMDTTNPNSAKFDLANVIMLFMGIMAFATVAGIIISAIIK